VAISRREIRGDSPVVIKADGLAAGKGVVVAYDPATAHQALDDLLVNHKLGRAGNQVLVEDYLEGWELSLFALTDGEQAYLLAPARDYKRAWDGDQGPNTGGMGAYSPPAAATPELLAEVKARILLPALRAIAEEAGAPFRGLLYAGLMITASGPFVVEFNARFGDPETQVVVPRLRGDFLQLCLAAAEGTLGLVAEPGWSSEAMCAVVMASAGYPGPFETGAPLDGLDRLDEEIMVFHAGTKRDAEGMLRSSGGRVLTVVAPGATVAEARARVYANLPRIQFAGAHWRQDIAAVDPVG
jgi:phosphoribosylamine--glycine ligase